MDRPARDVDSGDEFTTTANTIVNAAGPFVDEINQQWNCRREKEHRIVYSKGIHLVVRRLTTTGHHKVCAFFRRRVSDCVYVIPMGRRSVIGTTDARRHAIHRGHRRSDVGVPARPDQRTDEDLSEPLAVSN